MDIQKTLNELRNFDVNDMTLENIGTWPLVVKVIVWVIVFALCLTLGYYQDFADMQSSLDSEQRKESELKVKFEKMAFQAANLDAYRKQMLEMEESFGALLGQLPSDTEVPGLLEDITNKAVENGLEIASIVLKPEVEKEFYVELPMSIQVKGSYHDLGAFVSGVSGLPRIVTLHDFDISEAGAGLLSMNITAKTYRYKNDGGK